MSIKVPAVRQRHSLYGPTSPTLQKPVKPEPEILTSAVVETTPTPAPPFVAAKGLTAHMASRARSVSTHSNAEDMGHDATSTLKDREDSPVRFNAGSYNTISRERTISPPPRERAPIPPRSAYRPSLGQAITNTVHTSPALVPLKSDSSRQRRISAMPKPFLRPFPIRPQAQHTNSSNVIQRRASAMPTSGHPSLATLANRSVTAPPRSPSAAAILSPSSHASALHSAQAQTLRRPTSVQIRSDPTPFLSSIRPTITISSTPSFVHGTGRKSPATNASTVLHPSPSTGALRESASLQAPVPSKYLMSRKSMPAIGLPPPAPPPDIPLPPPPNMPLPAPPPTTPLPAPPISARQIFLA